MEITQTEKEGLRFSVALETFVAEETVD